MVPSIGAEVIEEHGEPETAPGSRDPALERAFGRLWREYYRRVWAFARSYAAMGAEEAEDATQEIMEKIYRALPRLDRRRPSAPWVFRIARNHCTDRMRSRGLRLEGRGAAVPADAVADAAPGPLEELLRSSAAERVRRFMESAGDADRQILYLAYYERMRLSDVAATLDMPEGTVKYRIHELKRRLRERIEEEER